MGLFDLVGGPARAVGRALIPNLFNQGLNPNRIVNQLKQVYGLSWRRQDMFADIRALTGLMKHERQWRNFPAREKPKRFLFTERDLGRAENYRLYGRLTYRDDLTGMIKTKNISFYIDKFDSLQDAADQWLEWKYESSYKEWETPLQLILTTGEHNVGHPW